MPFATYLFGLIILTTFAVYLSGRNFFTKVGFPMNNYYNMWWPMWTFLILFWPISIPLFVLSFSTFTSLRYVYDLGVSQGDFK